MQQERVHDQYPWTWETPLALVCAVLVGGVAACQLGRAVANWLSGAGWRWPTGTNLVTSIPSLLSGDATAGLPDVHNASNTAALYAWLACAGLLVAGGFTVASLWAWRRWGPGRMLGMATITEANELLGVERLWKVRHVVRPDLYPGRRKTFR